MLRETGIVTKVEGDFAWVNTRSKLACSSCKVESSCGTSLLEKYLSDKVFISKINNELSAKVGDQVVISIAESAVTKASFFVYSIPLLGLIIGAFLADWFWGVELYTIMGSLTGFLCALFVIQSYNQKITDDEHYQPRMVSKKSTGFSSSEFDAIKIKHL